LLKSEASFERLITEHKQKLLNFRTNPFAHDNRGLLKNATSDEIRQRIIEGRIKVLERQIAKQKGELAKIRILLGE